MHVDCRFLVSSPVIKAGYDHAKGDIKANGGYF